MSELSKKEHYFQSLNNISTVDGRESHYTRPLIPYLFQNHFRVYFQLASYVRIS